MAYFAEGAFAEEKRYAGRCAGLLGRAGLRGARENGPRRLLGRLGPEVSIFFLFPFSFFCFLFSLLQIAFDSKFKYHFEKLRSRRIQIWYYYLGNIQMGQRFKNKTHLNIICKISEKEFKLEEGRTIHI